jgi:Protein of unknown function (DUF2752)
MTSGGRFLGRLGRDSQLCLGTRSLPSRLWDVVANHFELWLLPCVVLTAWFYYPYCQHGPTLCLSQLLLHRPCPGCGLTRGVCFLVRGRLLEAVHFNPLSLVVLVLMSANFIDEIGRILEQMPLRQGKGRLDISAVLRF